MKLALVSGVADPSLEVNIIVLSGGRVLMKLPLAHDYVRYR